MRTLIGRVGRERIVLVHGFTQTARSWDRIAQDLIGEHEVVAVDAPGHGSAGALALDLIDGAIYLGDVGGVATYIGYSMGGRLCLHLALARPDLVRALVLVGATGGIDDQAERNARLAADNDLAGRLEREGIDAFLDRWMAQPMFANVPDDRHDRARNTMSGLASSLRLAGTGTQVPLWDRLRRLSMPVLVLSGEHDVKFTALAHRLADSIGENATVEIIGGAGHAAHLEQPEAFLAVVRHWLDSQPPSASPAENSAPNTS